jgi:hypothetical protein
MIAAVRCFSSAGLAAAVLVCCLVVAFVPALAAAATGPPNVIFMMADDLDKVFNSSDVMLNVQVRATVPRVLAGAHRSSLACRPPETNRWSGRNL